MLFGTLIFVKSPRFGTSGQWCASTAHGKSSISENHWGFHPNGSQATEAASIPEHTLPYRIYLDAVRLTPAQALASAG
jgi:hypothetical protein